jgi:hypothetical protein
VVGRRWLGSGMFTDFGTWYSGFVCLVGCGFVLCSGWSGVVRIVLT